jgi:hypothetical protein
MAIPTDKHLFQGKVTQINETASSDQGTNRRVDSGSGTITSAWTQRAIRTLEQQYELERKGSSSCINIY